MTVGEVIALLALYCSNVDDCLLGRGIYSIEVDGNGINVITTDGNTSDIRIDRE